MYTSIFWDFIRYYTYRLPSKYNYKQNQDVIYKCCLVTKLLNNFHFYSHAMVIVRYIFLFARGLILRHVAWTNYSLESKKFWSSGFKFALIGILNKHFSKASLHIYVTSFWLRGGLLNLNKKRESYKKIIKICTIFCFEISY